MEIGQKHHFIALVVVSVNTAQWAMWWKNPQKLQKTEFRLNQTYFDRIAKNKGLQVEECNQTISGSSHAIF